MIIRKAPPRRLGLDEPIRHALGHKRPVTRRDFIAQGLTAGLGTVVAPTIFSLFADPRAAMAALSPDLQALRDSCGISVLGAGKIPFICIDLAGGANMVGSNVLIGGPGGQLDFLSTAGYGKMGLPGDMLPSMTNSATGTSFTDTSLGLAFHSDSAFLRGIMDRISPATAAATQTTAATPRTAATPGSPFIPKATIRIAATTKVDSVNPLIGLLLEPIIPTRYPDTAAKKNPATIITTVATSAANISCAK